MTIDRCVGHSKWMALLAIAALLFVLLPALPQSGQADATYAIAGKSKRSSQSIKSQRRRLNRLQRSIEKTRSEIRQMNAKESSVVKSLNLYRKQSSELASSLELLEGELTRVQDSITTHESTIAALETELLELQKHYAELARLLQKAGTASDTELLVTGDSYEKDVRNSKYMHNITELANQKAKEIVAVKQEIIDKKQHLHGLLEQNQELVEQKSGEQQELINVVAANQKTLQSIRSNKSLLKKQLAEKQNSAQEVSRIMALLIAKEKQRKKEAERRNAARRAAAKKNATQKNSAPRRESFTGAEAPSNPQPQGAFGRRSLPWPVPSRTIIHPFGTSTNPATKITTENLGIGIKTARGTTVSAVYKGTVSLVHWLPGYGSLVIVDHGNGYRTVYANLSAVAVAEGEVVDAGRTIGRSGESVDGEYVHFEIWRDREKLNPSEWLN